jgi:hypothetical protein
MTIKTQVFATTLLTSMLLGSAMWANGIPPVGARSAPPVAACLESRAPRAAAPAAEPQVALVASATSCR